MYRNFDLIIKTFYRIRVLLFNENISILNKNHSRDSFNLLLQFLRNLSMISV